MRAILALLAVLLASSPAAWAQDPNAPEEEICIPRSVFDEIVRQQENFAALDLAVPKLTLGPIYIAVDRWGRVFYKSLIEGTLELGYKTFEVEVPVEVAAHRQERRPSIFGLRYKVGLGVDAAHLSEATRFTGFALIEPVRIGPLGLNSYLGTTSVGGALSFGITRSFCVFAGAGLAYEDGTLAVPLGASFSFN